MTNRLYVVGTPIGHLSDLSPRAAEVLRSVSLVAAEDTRVTRVLLRHVGSTARIVSAHQHNERAAAGAVLDQLRAGGSVALVSDAGTPAISDPGSAVVAAVHEAGFVVVPIPGPSAVVTLLSAAGLSEAPFLFEGFLPARPKGRDERLAIASRAADTAGALLVLYEAPHRIEATLEAIAARFGETRLVAIGRELTKTFEEVHRCPAAQAPVWLAEKTERRRGEFVIAIDRCPPAVSETGPALPEALELDRLLPRLLEDLPLSRAVKLAQSLTGLPHRELYARALALGSQAGGAADEDTSPAG